MKTLALLLDTLELQLAAARDHIELDQIKERSVMLAERYGDEFIIDKIQLYFEIRERYADDLHAGIPVLKQAIKLVETKVQTENVHHLLIFAGA